MKKMTMIMAVMVVMVLPVLAQGNGFDLQKADVNDRMTYQRAFEAVR